MSTLWHWIIDNKQWLFSGVAVAALGYALSNLLPKRRSNHAHSIKIEGTLTNSPTAIGQTVAQSVNYHIITPSVAAQDDENLLKASSPTGQQIFDEIESLPPYQRANAANHYVGLEICWLAKFVTIHPSDDDCHSIVLTARKHDIGPPYIRCEVQLSRYPKLKILRENHPIWVRGKISEIYTLGIAISNAFLVILD